MPDDETPDNQPEEQPSDPSAAEASGDAGEAPESAGGAEAEGSSAEAAPENAAASGEEAGAGSKTGGGTVAEDLAAQALKAAQEAVSGINSGGDEGDGDGGAGDDASAAADAAMAAMMEQQQQQQGGAGDGAKPLTMPSLDAGALADAPAGIDLLSDVNLDVTIELGRTRMYVEDVLKLAEGAVVELDKLAGDPVDIYVNQRHVAKGEVLILNENFCVRINEIVQLKSEAAAG